VSISIKAIAAAHQSGKGYKGISKQSPAYHSIMRKIYKWKIFKTTANLPRSGHHSKFASKSDCERNVKKSQELSAQSPWAPVSILNVKVHDSTIRKRQKNYGLFGRVAGKSLVSLKIMRYCVQQATESWGCALFFQNCICVMV